MLMYSGALTNSWPRGGADLKESCPRRTTEKRLAFHVRIRRHLAAPRRLRRPYALRRLRARRSRKPHRRAIRAVGHCASWATMAADQLRSVVFGNRHRGPGSVPERSQQTLWLSGSRFARRRNARAWSIEVGLGERVYPEGVPAIGIDAYER